MNEWMKEGIFYLQKHMAMVIHNINIMWQKTGNKEQYNTNIHVVTYQ